jgi:hypothetical protein
MAQDPNDPRIQEYYRQQRLAAEKSAIQGNTSAQQQLASIAGKLQHSGNAQREQVGNVDMAIAGKNTQAAKPVNVQDDPMAMGGDALGAAGSVLREIVTHPSVAMHVGKEVGSQIAKRLFPDAEEDLMSTGAGKAVAKTGAKSTAPRVVGKAKVSEVKPAQKALPKASAAKSGVPKGTENPLKSAMRKRTAQQTAKIKGAKARAGTKSSDAIAAKGSKAAPKALPKPKGESPKMQHENVSAGVKRNKNVRKQQDTARNKGTNKRAQPEYKRKTKSTES